MPLDRALDGVWAMMDGIFDGAVHEDNLRALRRDGVPNFMYNFKLGDRLHWGPFAMLVREAASRSREMSNHDYLGVPEIVQDICRGYQERFGLPIEDEVTAALRPCIVKFSSGYRLNRGCIEAAVYYLYVTAHGGQMSIHSNTCFDGDGLVVPYEAIEQVEFVGSA